MSKRGKRQHRATRRRAALRGAATSVSETPIPLPAAQPPAEPPHRRRRFPWAIAGVGAAIALVIAVALFLGQPVDEAAREASPPVTAGVPGGEVIEQATPVPTNVAAGTPAATTAPTPLPATAAPAPAATPEPQPTLAPTADPAPPASTPAPTAVVVAVAGPDDAVGAFYRHAAAGSFDEAYSLWSARMRDSYPRQENLDGRFAETESITFQQLFVAEQTEGTATVQANFTETYDSGATRDFIGYWELVRVDGRWLLDAPHY